MITSSGKLQIMTTNTTTISAKYIAPTWKRRNKEYANRTTTQHQVDTFYALTEMHKTIT
jgi:hypothetical protein